MNTTPRAAAIYTRISVDKNGDGLAIERQEALCRDLADRKGWPVAEVYVDRDISAYSGKRRPDYERLLADLASGARDAVAVVDADRLHRSPKELEAFIELCDRRGVALANVSGDLDLSSSDGRFKARILGAVSRQESEKKSERIKRQRDQAARAGKPTGGRRPYGYDLDRVSIREDEAAVIREVADRVLSSEPLRQIARDLTTRGIPSATGKPWSVTSLRTLLTGPRLAGLRVHRGEIVGDATWAPILDRATWERVRAVLGDPRRRQGGRPATHLLTGLLLCGRCGVGPLYHSTRSDTGAGRYTCARQPGHDDRCGRLAVAADPVEAEIRDQVIHALASDRLAAAVSQQGDEQWQEAAAELRADEADLELLAVDFAERRISRAEWMATREIITRRIEQARARLKTDHRSVPADLPTSEKGLRAAWDEHEDDVAWRRQLIATVIDHAVIGPGVSGRRRFDPARVEIKWRA